MSEKNTAGASEFERLVRADHLSAEPLVLTANESERAALAERFSLPSISALEAHVTLEADGTITRAKGRVTASFEQLCAITQEPFAATLDERIELAFVPETTLEESQSEEEEIELEAKDLDTIPFTGKSFDLGEQVAQTLGLAVDPYAQGPDADAARVQAGVISDEDAVSEGPLAAALAALKKD